MNDKHGKDREIFSPDFQTTPAPLTAVIFYDKNGNLVRLSIKDYMKRLDNLLTNGE